jgi:hypothetical protein
MIHLLGSYRAGERIYSISDLPSFLSGPKANQRFMVKRHFSTGFNRKIRYVNDDTKFCFFAATLVHLLANEPHYSEGCYQEWTSKVIINCFGMWQLALRLRYLNEPSEDVLDICIWLEDAERFFSRGYAVTGEIWAHMDQVGGESLLDPDYVYLEALTEPETAEDRKAMGLE